MNNNPLNRLAIPVAAIAGLALLALVPTAHAETLRLLTWGSYAPDGLIDAFEEEYPDITVEVTLSNNEEMISRLRATRGTGWDLAQPSHDRIYALQKEYDVYKPIDMDRIDTDRLDESLLEGVREATTIDGEQYAIPHMWGTSGIMVNQREAPEITGWGDLCDPKYEGKTSMRLRRTILLGTAFSLGHDPFAAYDDLDRYQEILDEVEEELIECRNVVRQYWEGPDDLISMMLAEEVVAAETWDSTAFRLYQEDSDIHFVPPETGALAWIDTFILPRGSEAEDAAYKWINFVMRPENVTKMSEHAGSIGAVKDGRELLPDDQKEAVQTAFSDEDIANLQFFAPIPPGIEEMEGRTLDRINAAVE